MVVKCPTQALALQDEVDFLAGGHLNFTAHRIGMAIAGVATLTTWVISISTIVLHLRNFWQPDEQRQIVRILMVPMVYSLCSLLGYRFFNEYEQLSLVEAASEGLALASFLMLLFAYVNKVDGGLRHAAIASKGRYQAPMPFCCVRYYPYKPAFLATLKWAVLQYGIVRIGSSIAGSIAQALNVLCPQSNSPKFANLWLEVITFVSISIAIWGLFLFYELTKDILKDGRNRPMGKFVTIKLLVAVLFNQEFIIKMLAAGGVIKATPYWTSTGVANSLICMLTCCEMILFALLMTWSFSWRDYRESKPYPSARTPFWKSLGHVLNIFDLALECWLALVFIGAYTCGKPGTHSKHFKSRLDAGAAFRTEPNMAKSASWELAEKPDGSKLSHTTDLEPGDDHDGEEREPRSYRHTLGAHTPEVNEIVEELHSDHYIEPQGDDLPTSGPGRRGRNQFRGEDFSFPPLSQQQRGPSRQHTV